MSTSSTSAYRVLARKYRPDSFSGLIGQDALVRTLSNALSLGRLAHAFVLTGVRGVGKTSTARILAKGLNCIGPDGNGVPTLEPCGSCEPCRSISEGRHVDVLEMDAASNTGVDDVREIIDGAAYRPVSARFKIYIIDEVHMLSKSAFNALLKTLEEPPEAVKFIFATTEIRKVPVTILSRCQRFDLRRVPTDMLSAHLKHIADTEAISADEAALRLIAIAGEGSVRDALSLLDQAAALSADSITADMVNDMLGRGSLSDTAMMLKACLDGQIAEALTQFEAMIIAGAEPEQVISDLLELIHHSSMAAAGAAPEDLPEATNAMIATLAEMGIARLGRAWQILLQGHSEMRNAPRPQSAAQMVLIRLAYTAPMPTPAEILEKLPDAPASNSALPNKAHSQQPAQPENMATQPKPTGPSAPDSTAQQSNSAPTLTSPAQTVSSAEGQASAQLDAAPNQTGSNIAMQAAIQQPIAAQPSMAPDNTQPEIAAESAIEPVSSLADIASLADKKGERILAAHIRNHVQLVQLAPRRLDVSLAGEAPADLLSNIAKHLSAWMGEPWMVSLTKGAAEPTLRQAEDMARDAAFSEAAKQPVVAEILSTFPGATITNIIDHKAADISASGSKSQDDSLDKDDSQ